MAKNCLSEDDITLIQTFRYDKGNQYSALFDPAKEKREVIVMVDECRRGNAETFTFRKEHQAEYKIVQKGKKWAA